MEQESFKMEGVQVTVECDAPVDVNEIREFVKGRVEFLDVRASVKYLQALSVLAEEVEKRKVDFVAYAQSFNELQAYKNTKLDGCPTTEKTIIDYEFRDKFLVVHKPRITLKIVEKDKPLLTLLESYRLLGFNLKNETTRTVLQRCITRERHGLGHSSFSTPEDVLAYCRKWDLSQDREVVEDFRSILTEVINSIETTTEGAEELKADVRKFVDSRADDFKKYSQDPLVSPSGHVVPSEIQSTHLAMELAEIAEEVVDVARLKVVEPTGPSIWERMKAVVQPHQGGVGFDDKVV
jgi:hypothetical protein